jgi:pimeloyl-ACP methyl ester carboxylesterase
VRLLAASTRGDVVGMVLVEPTHESAVLGSGRYGGMVRLREKAAGRPVPAPRLRQAGAPEDDAQVDYLAEELALLYAARVKQPQPFGRTPLVVLGGGRRPPAPPGIAADAWAALRTEREAQVRELAGLSANSRFVLDAGSGHNLHRDNPALVARSVEDVVRAARAGTPLTP